jgi:hypothetical protein
MPTHESKDYNGQGTRYNQFWTSSSNAYSSNSHYAVGQGLPIHYKDSSGGVGGYGLFQVTGVLGNKTQSIPREQIWNWQKNVVAAITEISTVKRPDAIRWMQSTTSNGGTPSRPVGQRPQAKLDNNNTDVPVPNHTVEGVTFADGTSEVIEDAVTIKTIMAARMDITALGIPACLWDNGFGNSTTKILAVKTMSMRYAAKSSTKHEY